MTGKIRFVAKSFIIHAQAVKAQEAAECAGEQGQYWQMGELLYERQSDWFSQSDVPGILKKYAGELGLDQASFDACLDEGKYTAKVQADYQEGQQAGAQGTPWLIINGVGGWGTEPYATLSQKIDYYLAGGKPPTLILAADSFQSQGKADAPMVITEFSDFQ